MKRFAYRIAVVVAAALMIGAAPSFTAPTATVAPAVQTAGGDVPSGG